MTPKLDAEPLEHLRNQSTKYDQMTILLVPLYPILMLYGVDRFEGDAVYILSGPRRCC
ncbi:hypothetical protein P152DRAFT_224607 [Eremomyces bilateralis CBS 781.70]|uniref:Uncharacterized protein n=1 Tax=Eremomyces bilateralis CBS 781.70 TaxID=1392243 RepID=A0A6G1FRA6_9PEZI|nr:uncharacterized protein P152DRAFT_224607 [Eremomyces bilateralis CBS 781.70]KAF1808375.1 hypothetical protein P152DRAFT_224607 [Eremomyces bilateralis CBS 781.70]